MRGFTAIEVIGVIVIIGALAMLAMPKMSIDLEPQLCGEKVLSHIRYTQHLGMKYDSFDPRDEHWQKKAWCIELKENSYRVIKNGELANNPQDGAPLDVLMLCSITPATLCFDVYGRPYYNDINYANLLRERHTTTVSKNGKEYKIYTEAGTGYTRAAQ